MPPTALGAQRGDGKETDMGATRSPISVRRRRPKLWASILLMILGTPLGIALAALGVCLIEVTTGSETPQQIAIAMFGLVAGVVLALVGCMVIYSLGQTVVDVIRYPASHPHWKHHG